MAEASAVVREARDGDAVEVARLCTLLAYPVDAATMAGRLQRLSASSSHAAWVAATPGDDARLPSLVAAEWRLMIEFGTRGEIVALVVDPAARRLGLGRRLVDVACGWVRAQGGSEVFVRSNVLRPESHAFYPGAGFERSKTQHVYVRRLAGPPAA